MNRECFKFGPTHPSFTFVLEVKYMSVTLKVCDGFHIHLDSVYDGVPCISCMITRSMHSSF